VQFMCRAILALRACRPCHSIEAKISHGKTRTKHGKEGKQEHFSVPCFFRVFPWPISISQATKIRPR
jgi:hypothetical protein